MGASVTKFFRSFFGSNNDFTQTSVPYVNNKSTYQLKAEIRQQLGIDPRTYHFAFVGETGVGKSSLINAIRGIFDQKNPNAAAIGATKTQSMMCYKDPSNMNINYWDLPGSGTFPNPASSYFDEKKLYAFDHLIIIGCARLLDFDINIARRAQSMNIPITIVRTKMDIDIENESEGQENCDIDEIKQHLRSQIIKSMKSDFEGANIKLEDVYFVNKKSFEQNKPKSAKYAMDEQRLIERIFNVSKNYSVS